MFDLLLDDSCHYLEENIFISHMPLIKYFRRLENGDTHPDQVYMLTQWAPSKFKVENRKHTKEELFESFKGIIDRDYRHYELDGSGFLFILHVNALNPETSSLMINPSGDYVGRTVYAPMIRYAKIHKQGIKK